MLFLTAILLKGERVDLLTMLLPDSNVVKREGES
jgi:hypothetical protein